MVTCSGVRELLGVTYHGAMGVTCGYLLWSKRVTWGYLPWGNRGYCCVAIYTNMAMCKIDM